MKEVTKWDNNPREMWVWDALEENAEKRFVIYIASGDVVPEYPVITYMPFNGALKFKHCAEIEERRRMTNKELARWLAEKPNRECKCGEYDTVSHLYSYALDREDDPVSDDVYVREGDSPWYVPFTDAE